jgi:hypothetical protein
VLDETNHENISIHHSENMPKGVTIAVQRCSVWCLFLRLKFILKKKSHKACHIPFWHNLCDLIGSTKHAIYLSDLIWVIFGMNPYYFY